MRLLLIAFASALVVACSDRASVARSGLVTVFDSTTDTITARVDGQVPVSSLRSLEIVMRIAPSVDDTSLFSDVYDFEVDAANRVWVYDFQGRRLFLFDSAGTLVRRIGRSGQGPGEFQQGNGTVALADTGVAMLDSRNARVSFFAANGDFRTSFPVPSGFSTNNGLISDNSHTLFLRRPVTPQREGEILGRMGLVRLKPDGTFGDSLLPPDLPVPRDTYIAISQDGSSRSSTSSSYAPNYFWDWHPDGFFVAAHGGNYEIVLARSDAKPIVIRRTAQPVSLLPDERKEEQDAITWNMRRTQPAWSWVGPDIPATKAPLIGITIARDGNIWARVSIPSEQIPREELEPQTEKGPPVRHYRSRATYEVFAPDGRFLGRVPMPPRTTMVQANGDYVWCITRDDNDVPSIVRFRIVPSLRKEKP
jgi:hypothetical protein